MQFLTFILIIFGNLGLKVVDDMLDEPVLKQKKHFLLLILGPLFIAALLILLDREGFLITGSYLLTAPFRGKADNKTFKIAISTLFGSFFVVYLVSFLTLPFFEAFINPGFLILLGYFILAIIVSSWVYDQIEPFFHFFLSTQRQFIVVIGKMVLALIPFHLTIVLLVYPFNLLSSLAFFASIGGFLAYGSAEFIMTRVLFRMINNESRDFEISAVEFYRTPSSYDSKAILDLSLSSAARSMGCTGVPLISPDPYSRNFVDGVTPFYLVRIASNVGIPFREFVCRRSMLVGFKLMEAVLLENP
ncbi:MAG: hypothetical protein ACFFBD_10675, partial [Candidatus Hodarchaeota archaeon]